MAATFTWSQSNDVGETVTDLGSSGNLFNFKSSDDATVGNYSSNPVTAGENSFEVYLRGKFGGTFNQIDNLQFWMSTDFSPNTGLSVTFAGDTVIYATPSETTSVDGAVPTSDPGTANVSIGGSMAGNLSIAGYSDYIRLQMQTTSSAPAGDTSLATFTLQYDEQ
jgi:hypothetical protein